MAKVKCARCGHVFTVTAINDIQVCDVCGQKMRIRPGAAAGNDEYAALRNEYMRLAREMRETNNGVYLTIEQYTDLVRQAGATASAQQNAQSAQPSAQSAQQVAQPVQPVAYPYPYPQPVQPVVYPYPYPQPVQPVVYPYNPYAAPVQTAPAATAPTETKSESKPAAEPVSAPEPALTESAPSSEPEKKSGVFTKKQIAINWISFGFVFLAALFSCLMLVFEVIKGSGMTGWTMVTYKPEAAASAFVWLLNLIAGVVIFLPVLLFLFALISTLRKGKGGKIALAIFFIIAAVLIWIFPNLYAFLLIGFMSGESFFDFAQMFNPLSFTWIVWVAAIMSFVAAIVLIVAGAMLPSKSKREELEESL